MSARRRREQEQQKGDSFDFSEMPLSEADAAFFGQIAAADSSLMVANADGSIRIGNFTLTATGLVIGQSVSEAEWASFGEYLKQLKGSLQWIIGDWCLHAENRLGKSQKDVAQERGISYQTLRDCAWVSSAIPLSLRKDNLGYNHHKVFAKVADDALKALWLDYAAHYQLSVSNLRKELLLIGDFSIADQCRWLETALSQNMLVSQLDDSPRPTLPDTGVDEPETDDPFTEFEQTIALARSSFKRVGGKQQRKTLIHQLEELLNELKGM